MSDGRFEEVTVLVERVLDGPAEQLVRLYYEEPDRGFAGDLFDEFGANPAGEFTADDLIAASMLDVRFGPRAVRRLLIDGADLNALLGQIPSDRDLWENVDTGPNSAAWELWNRLDEVPGIGRTRASKLLARKRPRLMPILDSVIDTALGLSNVNAWEALRAVLADASLRARINALVPVSHDQPPSTLRLLDVATWMTSSQSRSAKKARQFVSS